MATAFMKWLERRPGLYERGIAWLTFFRLPGLHAELAERYACPGARVLEIGCGTGALTAQLAQRGAQVVAIDLAPAMLSHAERKLREAGLLDQVTLKLMDAAEIGELTDQAPFDLIISSLAFSEMSSEEEAFTLRAGRELLAGEGRFVVLDEAIPDRLAPRLLFGLLRLPLRLLTWLLTRATTRPLRGMDALQIAAGYRLEERQPILGGALCIWILRPASGAEAAEVSREIPRLAYRPSIRTLLIDLWSLFLRIIPPYPKVHPRLYAVGSPDGDSPLLVTGNFELTVRRLLRAIDGRVDAWLLVVDSAGINVWCAAGGGFLTAEKVIGGLRASGAERVVRHHALILPQLCANGVDGWKIREATGWGVHWGPVKARDLPAYLESGRKKTDAMRWVTFPLKDRLEMVTVTLGFYALFILIPIAIFWRSVFWPATLSMLGISYFYAVLMPWLPGSDGRAKSLPLALIAWIGLMAFTLLFDPVPAPSLFRRSLGVVGLSIFSAAELQGMSPLMRGEQANWIWEGALGGALGLIYWLVPMALGWR